MNEVLMIVMAAGAVLGGVDRLRGNKWGFGDKFETGFMLLGSMGLSMAGMICLAPVLAQWLGGAIVPLYRLIGVDPAMFGGLLCMDMGGYRVRRSRNWSPACGKPLLQQLFWKLPVSRDSGRYYGALWSSESYFAAHV